MKKIFVLYSVLGVVLGANSVLAMPNFQAAQLSTPGTEKILVLPQTADNSPVISLGVGVDPATGEKVEGYAFIHYKFQPGRNGNVRQESHTTNTCFSFFAKGAKWKTVESWVVNPSNSAGLDGGFVFNNLTADIAKWEDAADGVIGNGIGVNILGNGSVTAASLTADTSAPDGQNEVYFADISNSGAIAVTIVWGVFSGPPFQRKLIEWDQVYDDVDFTWSSTGEAGKMDFENIATHEIGHSDGMGHPSDTCTEETMYRFAGSGETKKRDLNIGDITGIDKLY